jgi:hypothetical protein
MTLRKSKPVQLPRISGRKKAVKTSCVGRDFFDEDDFSSMLDLERKRSRRSKRPLILILINVTGLSKIALTNVPNLLEKALESSIRETDIRGWYMRNSIIGILFTDLNSAGHRTREILFSKILDALSSAMRPDDLRNVYVTFHTFPKEREDAVSCGRIDFECDHDRVKKNAKAILPLAVFSARICDFFGMKSCR